MSAYRGVNLGGWFVLEQWMKPDLFEGIEGHDETIFLKSNPESKEKLLHHWNTFIQKKDFEYLANIGIKHIRLPIPWWYMGESPYVESIHLIRKAMEWATEFDMKVLLDLHTAPGCQNGFDNGGIQNQIDWPKDQKNIDLTVEKLGDLSKIFNNYPSFFGIEVLNEPHWLISLTLLQDFYLNAYQEIRRHTDKLIVFHDGFRPDDTSWKSFFKQNKFSNVAFDLHLYHCFDPKITELDFIGHVDLIKDRIKMIKQISKFTKVIIGEWSLGMQHHKLNHQSSYDQHLAQRTIATLQLMAYEHAFAW
jgi:glucan 1,3-beta-glucosidase